MLSLLLPPRCPVCDRSGQALCARCATELVPAPPGPVIALVAYEGAGRALVTSLKYRNRRGALGPIAAALAARAPPGVDVVTWAPTTPSRRRHRGFDQAELLARAVARRMRTPARPLLRRGAGPAQTGRSRAERLDGPNFDALASVGGKVLVVDDVVTTGATLRSASDALRRAGASEVVAMALAATPAPRPQ